MEHWVNLNGVNSSEGSSAIVPAGQARVFAMTTVEGVNTINVVAVNPGESGEYFFAVDDYFEAQRDALLSLYNDTGGANWTSNSNWMGEAGTECDWYGIICEEV